MGRSKFIHLIAAAFLLGALTLSSARATPTPTVPAPALLDGFTVEWVQVDTSPHSIADALNAFNGTGGFNVLGRATQVLNQIDLQDVDVPFAGTDPLFAVRVSGYVTLQAGSNRFLSVHDAGLRLIVGGDTVIFDESEVGNRATDSANFSLAAGVYAYEALSWEQGGTFNLQLGIEEDRQGRAFLSGSHVAAVPEPVSSSLSILALVVAGLMARRRGTLG